MAIELPAASAVCGFAANDRGEYLDRTIYTLDTLPGLWRRVARSGRAGLDAGSGNVTAVRQLADIVTLIEVRRDVELEGLLRGLLQSDEEGERRLQLLVDSPIPDDISDPPF